MTDRLLFDTNVLLDVMMESRDPKGHAADLYERAISGSVMGFVFPGSLKDIEYIARHDLSSGNRRAWISEFLSNMNLAPFDRGTCELALRLDEPDYEDCLVRAAAELARCTHIVSRDAAAYLDISPMEKTTPELYLRRAGR